MFNFFLIIILFVLVIVLFGSLHGLKARIRFLERLLSDKRKQEKPAVRKAKEATAENTKEQDPWYQKEPVMESSLPETITQQSTVKEVPLTPSILQKVYDFFTGGNSIVRIGMVVFFIGIAFLLKYAADSGLLPIPVRLVGVACLAFALFALGYFLEKKRLTYAVTLEGGALAILYLLTFTSFYHYKVIAAGFAFACLVIITAFTLVWAIKRNVKALAVIGIIGGFIAPLLIKTNIPSATLLFSYYLILNIGVFITAWLRNWRELNVLGFIFTFIITALWYWWDYNANDFYIAESFLFIFFAFYLIIAVLSALKQPPNLKGFIEASLVFALPAIVFLLQAYLFNFRVEPLAYTAIILGAVYSCLSLITSAFKDKEMQPLTYAFAAIAIIFFTAAIPLLLSGEWTSAIWALEGTALIWVGIKQNRHLLRLGGIIIAILSNLYFYINNPAISHVGWFSNQILDSLLLTFTNLAAAYFLYQAKNVIKHWEYSMGKILFAIGALWWLAAIYYAVKFYLLITYVSIAFLSLISISALVAMVAEKACKWPWLRVISLSLLPFMIVVAFNEEILDHAFIYGMNLGYYWLVPFFIFYGLLYAYRNQSKTPYLQFCHIVTYLLAAWILSWNISHELTRNGAYSITWAWCVWAFVPSLFLLFLHVSNELITKCFKSFTVEYFEYLSWGFVCYLLAWVFIANLFLQGVSEPWPYWLLLNPLDLASFIALIFVGLRLLHGKNALIHISSVDMKIPAYTFAFIAFVWANAAILRFLHFQYAVAFSMDGFLQSQLTQVTLSLFWGVIALVSTVLANKKHWRPLWFVGAAMIAITILKLFLVDLSNSGTLERIVAFIGIGAILLIIGYFAPLPPKRDNKL